MTPEKALAHAVDYCDHRLPKWLPWQVEALASVLSLTIGWGTFRRRLAINLTAATREIDERIGAVAYVLMQDIQIAAAAWLADVPKPSANARAQAWLRKALACDHPAEYRSLPMGGECCCLQCGARLPL